MDFINYVNLNKKEKFEELMNTLTLTNRTPNYFINWEKVYRNTEEIELHLNTLNYLIGKEDIYEQAIKLFKSQPQLLQSIPTLLAIRDKSFPLLMMEDEKINYLHLDFNKIDINDIEKYVDFIKDTGLLDFLSKKLTNNLVDFVFGVEVGLDSNGRKNRSGSSMEDLVESKIEILCINNGYQFIEQATALEIKKKWGYDLPTDESKRRHDFAIFNPSTKRLNIIEVNYYGGGGSKLKSVAGEFTKLSKYISDKDSSIKFIWITDGQGWHTSKKPLFEAFNSIDYIINLDMLTKGYLDKILLL